MYTTNDPLFCRNHWCGVGLGWATLQPSRPVWPYTELILTTLPQDIILKFYVLWFTVRPSSYCIVAEPKTKEIAFPFNNWDLQVQDNIRFIDGISSDLEFRTIMERTFPKFNFTWGTKVGETYR